MTSILNKFTCGNSRTAGQWTVFICNEVLRNLPCFGARCETISRTLFIYQNRRLAHVASVLHASSSPVNLRKLLHSLEFFLNRSALKGSLGYLGVFLIARSAKNSPVTGPSLKPCPENPAPKTMLGNSGWLSSIWTSSGETYTLRHMH